MVKITVDMRVLFSKFVDEIQAEMKTTPRVHSNIKNTGD